jgi:soluble lytic murein transglycosylase-like protein
MPDKKTLDQKDKIIQKLLARREALKEELKTKHKEAYAWLIEHKIDLNNLSLYSQNITAAFLLSGSIITTTPKLPADILPTPTPLPTATSSGGKLTIKEMEFETPETREKKEARQVWEKYKNIINVFAEKYHVPPELIFATIMTESRGNPHSFRYEPHIDDASYGLGQILSRTAQGLGFNGAPEDLFNPINNIDLIARYYKRIMDNNKDATTDQLIAAYNTGSIRKRPLQKHVVRFKKWYQLLVKLNTKEA